MKKPVLEQARLICSIVKEVKGRVSVIEGAIVLLVDLK